MTTETQNNKAIPHDGWKSRKVRLGAGVLVAVIGIGAICVFVSVPGGEGPVATFDQWKSLVTFVVPSVLLPLFGALGLDKFAQVKAANGKK